MHPDRNDDARAPQFNRRLRRGASTCACTNPCAGRCRNASHPSDATAGAGAPNPRKAVVAGGNSGARSSPSVTNTRPDRTNNRHAAPKHHDPRGLAGCEERLRHQRKRQTMLLPVIVRTLSYPSLLSYCLLTIALQLQAAKIRNIDCMAQNLSLEDVELLQCPACEACNADISITKNGGLFMITPLLQFCISHWMPVVFPDGHAGMAPLLTLQRRRSHILVIRNETAWWHPMHCHGHTLKVLSEMACPSRTNNGATPFCSHQRAQSSKSCRVS